MDNITLDAARYAVTFAADSNVPDHINTHEFEELAVTVGINADTRNYLAGSNGRDFYPCAFVEAAAQHLNKNPRATLDELLAAGQREVDSLLA